MRLLLALAATASLVGPTLGLAQSSSIDVQQISPKARPQPGAGSLTVPQPGAGAQKPGASDDGDLEEDVSGQQNRSARQAACDDLDINCQDVPLEGVLNPPTARPQLPRVRN